MKYAWLVILGFLWSARLAAIKFVNLSSIPLHVIVSVSFLGIALVFSTIAIFRQSWPPVQGNNIRFYFVSGLLGFVLPFLLENLVAPHLAVFVFIVIISMMPILTFVIAVITGVEKPAYFQIASLCLGLVVAFLVAFDTTHSQNIDELDLKWIVIAFGVPILYAVNTLFIASRWPSSADSLQVAHAQAIVVSIFVVIGSITTKTVGEWPLAVGISPAIVGIVAFEALALIVYLKITREHGATFVAQANYISMVFAAVIGYALFGDRLTWLSAIAAALLIGSLELNRRGRVASDT